MINFCTKCKSTNNLSICCNSIVQPEVKVNENQEIYGLNHKCPECGKYCLTKMCDKCFNGFLNIEEFKRQTITEIGVSEEYETLSYKKGVEDALDYLIENSLL